MERDQQFEKFEHDVLRSSGGLRDRIIRSNRQNVPEPFLQSTLHQSNFQCQFYEDLPS